MNYHDPSINTIDVVPEQADHLGVFLDVLYQNRGMIALITACFLFRMVGGICG
ncbi:hypothetical protein R69746_08517 [Paraburkholderia aspalathi]|nr:hypothetical protein [Paraburkholderia aspalathi]CAE6872283.1 hypothetical protein R69746_08517 [Paraburkholderia aspalathi]